MSNTTFSTTSNGSSTISVEVRNPTIPPASTEVLNAVLSTSRQYDNFHVSSCEVAGGIATFDIVRHIECTDEIIAYLNEICRQIEQAYPAPVSQAVWSDVKLTNV